MNVQSKHTVALHDKLVTKFEALKIPVANNSKTHSKHSQKRPKITLLKLNGVLEEIRREIKNESGKMNIEKCK